MTEYNQRYDKEWYDVTDDAMHACCDCGLVHDRAYRIMHNPDGTLSIVKQVIRNEKETKKLRRKAHKCVIKESKN